MSRDLLFQLTVCRYFKLALVVLVTFFSTAAIAGTPVRFEFIDDPSGTLNVPAAFEVFKESSTSNVLETGLSRGFTRSVSWLKTDVPKSSNNTVLHLSPGYLNHLQVFLVSDKNEPVKLFDSYEASAMLAPNFSVLMPKGVPSSSVLLIRLQTTTSQVLMGEWMTQEEFESFSHHSYMRMGGYLTVMFVLAAFYLLIGFRLRSLMHSVYAFYLIAIMGITLFQHGFANLVPFESWQWFSHVVGVAVGLSFVLMALFFKLFFRVSGNNYPRSNLLIFSVIGLGSATALLAWSDYYVHLAPLAYLVGYVLLANAVFLAYKAGHIESRVEGRIFFFAFAQSCIAVVLTTATLNQWIPLTEFGLHAYSVSVVFQASLLLIGFVERLNYAENKALEAAERAEFNAVTIAADMTKEVFEASEKLHASLKRERELRQSHEHFINTINHEYRTPLAIIKGNVDMVKLRFPEVKAFSEKIDRAMTRLQQLFEQTLRGYQELNTEKVEMESVEIVSFVQQVIATSLIDTPVKAFYPECDIAIQTDKSLLRTALINLLDNADKYVFPRDASAEIDVTITEDENCAYVLVANNYNPLMNKPTDNIFQPYVRGGQQMHVSGLGFGLYLTKSNIEKVGGSIKLVPNNDYRFTVLVTLPRNELS